MKAMTPDQIREQLAKEKAKDLQGKIFFVIMLVIAPVIVAIGMIVSLLS